MILPTYFCVCGKELSSKLRSYEYYYSCSDCESCEYINLYFDENFKLESLFVSMNKYELSITDDLSGYSSTRLDVNGNIIFLSTNKLFEINLLDLKNQIPLIINKLNTLKDFQ
jgi:hypothetical protein